MSKAENYQCVVSVLGYTAHGKVYKDSSDGTGKSCLCCRLTHPALDDYIDDHPSLLALHEFESKVICTDNFLFWGTKELEYPSGSSKGKPTKVKVEVVEHTLFYHDETSRVFPRYNKLHDPDKYTKQALIPPDSSRKISYYARDCIGFPDRYRCIPYPSNVNRLPRGFIIVCDVSIKPPHFEAHLVATEQIAHRLYKDSKLPFIIAATKRDSADSHSLQKLHEWASKKKISVVETSAKDNINVKHAFMHIVSKILKNAKLGSTVVSYTDAIGESLLQSGYIKQNFKVFLGKKVRTSNFMLSSIENSPEYIETVELVGKFIADEIYAKHLLCIRDSEVRSYQGVLDNPDMRMEMLEQFVEEISLELAAHKRTLKSLINVIVSPDDIYQNGGASTTVTSTTNNTTSAVTDIDNDQPTTTSSTPLLPIPSDELYEMIDDLPPPTLSVNNVVDEYDDFDNLSSKSKSSSPLVTKSGRGAPPPKPKHLSHENKERLLKKPLLPPTGATSPKLTVKTKSSEALKDAGKKDLEKIKVVESNPSTPNLSPVMKPKAVGVANLSEDETTSLGNEGYGMIRPRSDNGSHQFVDNSRPEQDEVRDTPAESIKGDGSYSPLIPQQLLKKKSSSSENSTLDNKGKNISSEPLPSLEDVVTLSPVPSPVPSTPSPVASSSPVPSPVPSSSLNLKPKRKAPPKPDHKRTGGQILVLPPTQEGQILIPTPTQKGQIPVLPPTQEGETPVPTPTKKGQTPVLPTTHEGQTPVLPPTQKGQTPIPTPTKKGQIPVPPPSQEGQTPVLPPTQEGQSPAPTCTLTQKGQTPVPPLTQKGQTPVSPLTQKGQTPVPPLTQKGQTPVPTPMEGQTPVPTPIERGQSPVPPLPQKEIISEVTDDDIYISSSLDDGDDSHTPFALPLNPLGNSKVQPLSSPLPRKGVPSSAHQPLEPTTPGKAMTPPTTKPITPPTTKPKPSSNRALPTKTPPTQSRSRTMVDNYSPTVINLAPPKPDNVTPSEYKPRLDAIKKKLAQDKLHSVPPPSYPAPSAPSSARGSPKVTPKPSPSTSTADIAEQSTIMPHSRSMEINDVPWSGHGPSPSGRRSPYSTQTLPHSSRNKDLVIDTTTPTGASPPPLPPRTPDMKEYVFEQLNNSQFDRKRSKTTIVPSTTTSSLNNGKEENLSPKKTTKNRRNYLDVVKKFVSKSVDSINTTGNNQGEVSSTSPEKTRVPKPQFVNMSVRPLPAPPEERDQPTLDYEPVDGWGMDNRPPVPLPDPLGERPRLRPPIPDPTPLPQPQNTTTTAPQTPFPPANALPGNFEEFFKDSQKMAEFIQIMSQWNQNRQNSEPVIETMPKRKLPERSHTFNHSSPHSIHQYQPATQQYRDVTGDDGYEITDDWTNPVPPPRGGTMEYHYPEIRGYRIKGMSSQLPSRSVSTSPQKSHKPRAPTPPNDDPDYLNMADQSELGYENSDVIHSLRKGGSLDNRTPVLPLPHRSSLGNEMFYYNMHSWDPGLADDPFTKKRMSITEGDVDDETGQSLRSSKGSGVEVGPPVITKKAKSRPLPPRNLPRTTTDTADIK